MTARGATTIRGLGRTFRALDSYDGNRKVDAGEFFVGLQENGVKLTKAEADVRNIIVSSLISYRPSCSTSTLMAMVMSTSMNSLLESE